jgi:uncharacterized protein YrrD
MTTTLFSAAHKRDVVSIDTATTIGRIADCIIDPAGNRLAAFILNKTDGDEQILPWAAMAAFGDDAVTVTRQDALVTADQHLTALCEKRHRIHGKRVLTSEGHELGVVADIAFDSSTGAISALVLHDGTTVSARILAAGSYAIIVEGSGIEATGHPWATTATSCVMSGRQSVDADG